jgi:N-acetylmuramoyl-L-alanine amidase
MNRTTLAALFGALAVTACSSPEPQPEPLVAPVRDVHSLIGDEIVVCGERVHIGAPVVLWTDVDGYDATATTHDREVPPEFMDPATGRRYTPGRVTRDGEVLVPPDSTNVAQLAEVVDQFVLHYDVAGTSRTCFRVLQEMRGLSVHFLLDIDGTIYQTLDLRERAWHASQANTRSIGVEIAQMGARSPGQVRQLEEWYRNEPGRTRLTVPARYGDGGVHTRGFQGETLRPGLLSGQIHGADYVQYDFTPEQYGSLIKLIAGVSRALPRIAPDAPRGADGRVLTRVLTDAEYENFGGVIGHYHLTEQKIDPGPAFDWEGVLYGVRRELRRADR